MTVRLEHALGHVFADPALLETALTHRSHGQPHNERLEFLGDSILNGVIARALYQRFPDMSEGDLSRLRANLVRQDALHQLANGLALGGYLRLGEGELRSGGATRPSILADALEALFGAVWLDAGFDIASQVIEGLYADKLTAIVPGQPIKDPKTRLQEYLQAQHLPLPKYVLASTTGNAHEQRFAVTCDVSKPKIRAEGHGTSRRIAEQSAAEAVLRELGAV